MDSDQLRGSGFVCHSLASGYSRLDEASPASGGIGRDEVAPVSSSLPILPLLSRPSSATGAPPIVASSAGPDGCFLDASSSLSTGGVECLASSSVPGAGVDSLALCSGASGEVSVLLPSSTSATPRPWQGILPSPTTLSLPPLQVCPVTSHQPGQSAGSTTVSSVSSGALALPDSARQRSDSKFEFSDSDFPPLLSHPADSDGPTRGTCPLSSSTSDLPLGSESDAPFSRPAPFTRPVGSDAPINRPAVSNTPIAPITRPAPSSWASLVKDSSSNMQLKFIKPVPISDDGKLKIKLPPAIADKGASVWKDTLVGFFLDNLPFSLVHSAANRLWGKFGLTDVLSNGNGFFFFKFSESGSLNLVLESGPWYFGGRPIFLKLWAPGMNLSKEGCKRVPIWAHFYNVPLELWTDEGLSFIASMVGRPLHADSSTSSFKRLQYARICIEINIDDSLPNAFDIELEDGSCLEIQIVYNWVPKKCSVCKEFGHLSKNCKKASHRVWIPKSAQPSVPPPGDWQTVNNHVKVGLDKSSSSPSALLPHPAKAVPQPIIQAGGLCCSSNIFDCLHSEDVPPSSDIVDNPSYIDQSSAIVDKPSKATSLPVASEFPAAPLACSPARLVRECPLSGLPSPSSGSVISTPSSSPPASSLLAKKLIMVDEVEQILGRKMKDKKKNRSSGNSKGKTSKSSK